MRMQGHFGVGMRGLIDAISVPTLAHLTIRHSPGLRLDMDCGHPRPSFEQYQLTGLLLLLQKGWGDGSCVPRDPGQVVSSGLADLVESLSPHTAQNELSHRPGRLLARLSVLPILGLIVHGHLARPRLVGLGHDLALRAGSVGRGAARR